MGLVRSLSEYKLLLVHGLDGGWALQPTILALPHGRLQTVQWPPCDHDHAMATAILQWHPSGALVRDACTAAGCARMHAGAMHNTAHCRRNTHTTICRDFERMQQAYGCGHDIDHVHSTALNCTQLCAVACPHHGIGQSPSNRSPCEQTSHGIRDADSTQLISTALARDAEKRTGAGSRACAQTLHVTQASASCACRVAEG